MLALRKTKAAFGLELTEMPEPGTPGPGMVLIEVAAVGICGSDLHAYEWTSGYEFMAPLLPVTLGHEFAGEVAAVGPDVRRLEVGQKVTAWPTVACGFCPACRRLEPQLCVARGIIGLHSDGGFARRVLVPAANCFPLPDGLPLRRAALCEPLCIAAHSVAQAEIGLGDRVLVLGPGPIGLMIAWLAQRQGARVMLAGLDDAFRLALARRIGIARTVDLASASLADAIGESMGGEVDRVIEATGVPESIGDGLNVLRPGGIVVATGIHARPLVLDLTRLVRNKQQLRGAHDTTQAQWPAMIELLAREGEALEPLITTTLPLSAAVEGFEMARRKEAMKVMVEP